MQETLNNIRIVLIETSHPGNIGSAARAMKTMGLTSLYLVKPKRYPSPDAIAMASNADDVLESAVIVNTLQDAIADCQIVYGTSSRHRYLQWPLMSAREAGQSLIQSATQGNQIAIVFGNERTGMTNAELQQCHYHVSIPTNPDYASLNLAQAVQILCYECYCAVEMLSQQHKRNADIASPTDEDALATQVDMTGFYQHLEQSLIHIGFAHPHQQTPPMARLKRLFQRAQCCKTEVHILRGICKKILQLKSP